MGANTNGETKRKTKQENFRICIGARCTLTPIAYMHVRTTSEQKCLIIINTV